MIEAHGTVWATVIFTLVVVVVAAVGGHWAMAAYALGFWHYAVYGLAYFIGAIELGRFRRDAMLTKSLSLAVFLTAYVTSGPTLLSLVVMAIGFGINIAGAAALGSDRTYYGYEIGGMPPERVSRFPFSVLPHPMITGNILAFGAPLLAPEFREDWWPIAVIHVALNAGLLAMELFAKPKSWKHLSEARWPHRPQVSIFVLAIGAILAGFASVSPIVAFGFFLCALSYGWTLLSFYCVPNLQVKGMSGAGGT